MSTYFQFGIKYQRSQWRIDENCETVGVVQPLILEGDEADGFLTGFGVGESDLVESLIAWNELLIGRIAPTDSD